MTAIAAHLKVGRSTLYRALQPDPDPATAPASDGSSPDGPSPLPEDAGSGPIDARRPIRARIRRLDEPMTWEEPALRERLVRQRKAMAASSWPTCGNEPVDAHTRWRQRQDLAITWLYPDHANPSGVLERVHCSACQPHQQVATVCCELCGDGERDKVWEADRWQR